MSISTNNTIKAGEKLLQAYVQMRAGNSDEAYELFEEATDMESFDALADGIANSIKQLKGSEEDDDSDYGDLGDSDDDDDEDIEAYADYTDDDDDEDDDEEPEY